LVIISYHYNGPYICFYENFDFDTQSCGYIFIYYALTSKQNINCEPDVAAEQQFPFWGWIVVGSFLPNLWVGTETAGCDIQESAWSGMPLGGESMCRFSFCCCFHCPVSKFRKEGCTEPQPVKAVWRERFALFIGMSKELI
jgi:hypothetical protein